MKAISNRTLQKCAKLGLALVTFVLLWFTLGPGAVIKRGVSAPAAKSDTRGTAQSGIAQQDRFPLRASEGRTAQTRLLQRYGQLPLSFEANRGQTDARVKFLSRGHGYTLFLTSDEVVLGLVKPRIGNPRLEARRELPMLRGRSQKKAESFPALLAPNLGSPNRTRPMTDSGQVAVTDAVLHVKPVGMNPTTRITPLAQLPGKSNYLIGNDPKKWHTNVPTYAKVKYNDVYPGVDLVYYGNQGQLEYDFVVAPGVDPGNIALDVVAEGVSPSSETPKSGRRGARRSRLSIDDNGDLLLGTLGGAVVFHKPLVYQQIKDNGQRTTVGSRYVLRSDHEVTFEVASYDRTRPLVIDPILTYSTYLGGSGDELTAPSGTDGIALDPAGNAYVIGATSSADFPAAPGALQTSFAGGSGSFGCFNSISADAFVTKLNARGDTIIYSTYLGGNDDDCGEGIAVDPSGNAYVAGETLSTDFPVTRGAFQPACASCSQGMVDTFAAKLSRDGSALVYSTYLGGNDEDLFPMLALDRFGNLYIQGTTFSTDYPTTPGVFQPACASCANGNPDTYVTKLNSDGSALVYSTYLGGNDFDACGAQIAVDSIGSVYVNGFTCSNDFPTHNSLQGYAGGCDAFLTKLNPAGTALVYSTYLGGSDFDIIFGTAVDLSGNAYVSGGTGSSDFPTSPGAFQTNLVGGFEAFVTKINPSGSAFVYSTYLGGTGDQAAEGIAVDYHGNAFVAGQTTSTDFPVLRPLQRANAGGFDVFVTELNPTGRGLVFSSYLGGTGDDSTSGIALDRQRRNVYVAGTTASSDFPTVHAAQSQFGGGTFDAFVVKISPDNPPAGALALGLLPSSTGRVNRGAEKPSVNGILPSWKRKMGMARKAAR